MIPESFIHQLLDRVDLAEVIQRYVRLKKTGSEWSGLCPFHSEKTPSFTVSPAKQFYHCFGCGAHGTALTFLMKQAGYNFREAVESLAQPLGLVVPDERVASPEIAQQKNQLDQVMTEVVRFYRQQLKQSSVAIDYLKNRGLTGEIAARFGLGYAPNDYHYLQKAFPTTSAQSFQDAGLMVKNERGKTYDRFRHRVMFPITNAQGHFIGFGARSLDGSEPKYLNSPETPLFSKGRELYGFYQAKAPIAKAGYCWVTEGYFDVLTLAQFGIEHVVASLGTAVTADQLRKLLRHTDKLVFCFDGDAAGKKAAIRVMGVAAELATDQRNFSFLFLPTGHDPDSFVREYGRDRFDQLQSKALPLSRLLIQQWATGRNLDILEERAAMLDEAKTILSKMSNAPVLRSAIIAELAEQTGLQFSQIDQLAKTSRSTTSRPAVKSLSLADRLLSILFIRPGWRLKVAPETGWLSLPGIDCELLAAAIRVPETVELSACSTVSEESEFVRILLDRLPEAHYREHLLKVVAFRRDCPLTEEELHTEWLDGLEQMTHNWQQREINQLKRLAMERPLNDEEHQRMYHLISLLQPARTDSKETKR